MSTLKIPTAKAFEPLLVPSRYKAAYGGRGSGKSHFFAELLTEICEADRGTRAVCIRESQKTLSQSSKRLIESKIASLNLSHRFRIYSDRIVTPGDGVIIFRGMADHTAASIKSLEGFRIAWIDEAQSLSARSLALLRPTIRAANSELWASWNPYNIPLGGGLDYWGTTAPNSNFAFPFGQAISRSTYSALFALVGTTYGTGDGSTTFNLPDKRGRVSACLDTMGATDAGRLTGGALSSVRGNLGGAGGEAAHMLTSTEIPLLAGTTSAGTSTTKLFVNNTNATNGGATPFPKTDGSSMNGSAGQFEIDLLTPVPSVSVSVNSGGGGAHNNIQPTILCNYIMRII